MNNPPLHPHSPLPATIGNGIVWRGVLGLGLLWLLAVFCMGVSANHGLSDTDRRGIAASVDMPLHANSEHTLSLKRFLSRHKTQPNTLYLPEPFWLLASEFRAALASLTFKQFPLPVCAPNICWQQLQSLNVPRAPPLV